MSETPKPKCQHCGSDRIYSGPPDCPTCGAPNCCQTCCKITTLERELAEANGKLNKLSRMIDIAQQADDAKSETEIACSATFSEAMAYQDRDMMEQERDSMREQISAAKDAFNRIRELVGATEQDHMPAEHYVSTCIQSLREQLTDADYMGNLLAIIHCDGGHYRAEHGNKKATDDAIQIFCSLKEQLTKAQTELKELRKDRDRLDFMDKTLTGVGYNVESCSWQCDIESERGKSVRTAIDKAIEKGKG